MAVEFIAGYRTAWRPRRRDGGDERRGTATAMSLWDIERRDKPKRVMRGRHKGGANRSRTACRWQHCQWRRSLAFGSQGQRRGRGLFRIFEQSRRHILAGLHWRNADEVATAGKNRLTAESHDVLALFHQQGFLRPLDFIAFAERGER